MPHLAKQESEEKAMSRLGFDREWVFGIDGYYHRDLPIRIGFFVWQTGKGAPPLPRWFARRDAYGAAPRMLTRHTGFVTPVDAARAALAEWGDRSEQETRRAEMALQDR